MTIRRNIAANYAGQLYVSLVAILIVPLYFKYMGEEAYGLVGFYSMLQAWFLLLDMGLTPTMARETARFHGGVVQASFIHDLLRSLTLIFVAIATFVAGAFIASSGVIATRWLDVQSLPIEEVQRALTLTALIIALRWVSGLYRGVISGSERLLWLNAFNILIATLRFIAVIPILIWVGASPTYFFSFQLCVALLECIGLIGKSYSILPKRPTASYTLDWRPLKDVLRFSLGVAFTSVLWIIASQMDKLILSKILTLKEYAYFTLAALAATSISFINGPISGALLPRLTKLYAEHNTAALLSTYRNATQLATAIAASASAILTFFAHPVLLSWTHNLSLANQTAPILSLYAIGNAITAIGSFPYLLQFAHGKLRLQYIGSALFALSLIPAIFVATAELGAVGAGYAWISVNSLYVLLFLPIVHHSLYPKLHMRWLVRDVLSIATPPYLIAYILTQLHPLLPLPTLALLTLYSALTLSCAVLASPFLRAQIQRLLPSSLFAQ